MMDDVFGVEYKWAKTTQKPRALGHLASHLTFEPGS